MTRVQLLLLLVSLTPSLPCRKLAKDFPLNLVITVFSFKSLGPIEQLPDFKQIYSNMRWLHD